MVLKDVTLGATYQDRVSGFRGIAISKTLWLNDCMRVGLQGRVNKDNEAKSNSYDVEDLEYVNNGVLESGVAALGNPNVVGPTRQRRGTGGGGRNDNVGARA
jgi:hypothetical protein